MYCYKMTDIPDEGDALDKLTGSTLPVVVEEVLNNFLLAKLAREIAMNIREVPEILKTFKLSAEQYAAIEKIPFYKNVLDQYIIEWESARNTGDRLKIEAAAGLESAMPSLTARMQSEREDLGKAAEVAKLFSKIAGVEAGAAQSGNPGDKFSITINLGEDVKLQFDKEIEQTAPKIIEAIPSK